MPAANVTTTYSGAATGLEAPRRKACHLHFIDSGMEALGAYLVHRKEAECLHERYPVRSEMQEFNVRTHFPKNCAQGHLSKSPLGKGSLHQQCRSSCQRQAPNDTKDLLVIDRKDCFFLGRGHGFEAVGLVYGTCRSSVALQAGLQRRPGRSTLLKCFGSMSVNACGC
jgi:hypothetical protein